MAVTTPLTIMPRPTCDNYDMLILVSMDL